MFQIFQQLLQLLFVNFVHVSIDKFLQQISSHHVLNSEQCQPCSVVCNPVLRVIVCPDLLAPVHCPDLRLSTLRLCLNRLLVLNFEQSFLQNLSCPLSVMVLTTLLLNEHTQTSWNVSRATGWVCFLDWLPTCAAWSCVLILDVFIIDYKGEGNRRHKNHGNGRRMKSSLAFSFRHSDNFVYTWLAFHDFVWILPSDLELEIFVTFGGNSFLNLC